MSALVYRLMLTMALLAFGGVGSAATEPPQVAGETPATAPVAAGTAPAEAVPPAAATVDGRARSHRPAAARPRQSGLDARVQLLAKELDLDTAQQSKVRAVLVRQREDVREAWANEATPAPLRVAATRAIGERTADSIRAILTDKQREKYLKRPQELPGHDQGVSDLDTWINGVGSR